MCYSDLENNVKMFDQKKGFRPLLYLIGIRISGACVDLFIACRRLKSPVIMITAAKAEYLA